MKGVLLMLDILSALYHEDPIIPDLLCNLDHPETPEERKVAVQLRAIDENAAEALRSGILGLADSQTERAFYSGARFGAQLMVQLLGIFTS